MFLHVLKITEELEVIKSQMDERGTSMTDSGEKHFMQAFCLCHYLSLKKLQSEIIDYKDINNNLNF